MTQTAGASAPPSPSPSRGAAQRGRLLVLRVAPGLDRRVWWGHPWQMATASYWASLALSLPEPVTYRIGGRLDEEVAACVLGGYGIAGAVGNAAFGAVRAAGLLDPGADPDAAVIERLLAGPLHTPHGRTRYRFPRQRSRRLAAALAHVRSARPPDDDVEMRDWLTAAPGVGPKTASWIVRNHRSSGRVAVVDVHLVRAGNAAGVFDPAWRLPRDYALYEGAFLAWAAAGAVGAARLDACIWGELARAGTDARDVLGVARLTDVPPPVWPCRQPAPLRATGALTTGPRAAAARTGPPAYVPPTADQEVRA